MAKIVVVGHKNPDSDSIISAIAAQEFFFKALGEDAQAFRAGELNNETKFILEKIGVDVPPMVGSVEEGDSVALVDHNEISQVFDGLDYAKVAYIIDHHKVAIVTEKPIFCRMAPLGSTSSIIAQLFFAEGLKPSEKTAKLLVAGILSDTLKLTSPTTTQEDKILVEKLNDVAKLDVDEFVAEMFHAKSSLEGIATGDIITLDYKNFEMGSCKVGVGTWETTAPESVNEKKAEIIYALREKKEADKLDYIFFMVVDILNQYCELYIVGEKEKTLAEKVFGKQADNDAITLAGVVSRKKQIIPQLTEELSK